MKLHRLAWLAGVIGLPISHYWLVEQVEPFYSSIYCFLWWSYIFTVDFAVYCLRGRSLLSEQPREFWFLAAWSVPVWMLFEMVNLRLQNWYYVMSPYGFSWGTLYLALAFATVLPGVFETASLVLAVIEKVAPGKCLRGHPFAVSRLNISLQTAVGAAMLALMLAFPRSCFCLAWGFAYFLIDPLCYWFWRKEKDHKGRSLLGQVAAGDNTRLVAVLAAGFICGGLWEAWNLGARTKWIYSVPYFDQLKLGEMPLLGFMGFPPFALECYAVVNFLSLLRGGRNWELSRQENAQYRGMPAWGVTLSAILLPAGVLAACVAILYGGTVASYALPLDRFFSTELGRQGVKALEERQALQGHQFLKLWGRPPEIDPALFGRLRRVARMGEIKGMGLKNALALEKLGIKRIQDLAVKEPAELFALLSATDQRLRQVEVEVWIREARRKTKIISSPVSQ